MVRNRFILKEVLSLEFWDMLRKGMQYKWVTQRCSIVVQMPAKKYLKIYFLNPDAHI